MLVRKHPLALTFTERLYDAFGDDSVGWEAAKAVGDIVSPDAILTKANHAEIKVRHNCVDTIIRLKNKLRSFLFKNTSALSFLALSGSRRTAMVGIALHFFRMVLIQHRRTVEANRIARRFDLDDKIHTTRCVCSSNAFSKSAKVRDDKSPNICAIAHPFTFARS